MTYLWTWLPVNKSELLCWNWKCRWSRTRYFTVTVSFISIAVCLVCFSVQSSICAKERGLHLPSSTMSSPHWWHGGGVFLWRRLYAEGRLQIYYLPERRMEQSHADELCVQSRWILSPDFCQTTSVLSIAPSSTSVLWAIFLGSSVISAKNDLAWVKETAVMKSHEVRETERVKP